MKMASESKRSPGRGGPSTSGDFARRTRPESPDVPPKHIASNVCNARICTQPGDFASFPPTLYIDGLLSIETRRQPLN